MAHKRRSAVQIFRSRVSGLKKAGLIPKSIDARKVTGATRIGIFRADTIINFLYGKPAATPAKTKQTLAKKGFKRTRKSPKPPPLPRTTPPPLPRPKVKKVPRGTSPAPKAPVTPSKAKGPVEVTLPIQYHDLESWLNEVELNSDDYNELKGEKEYFSFSFFGNHSYAFEDIGVMISKLRDYNAVKNSENEEQDLEVFENIKIYKFPDMAEWETPTSRRRNRKHKRTIASKKRYRESVREGAFDVEQHYLDSAAERQRKYRASLKGPAKRKYKAAARKRERLSTYRKAEIAKAKAITKKVNKKKK